MDWNFKDFTADISTEKGRILAIFQDLGLTKAEIASETGLSAVHVSDVADPKKPKVKPGRKFINAIVSTFSEYDREWIETGKGQMKHVSNATNVINSQQQEKPIQVENNRQISDRDYWILYGENKILSRENDWYKEKFLDVLNRIEQKALTPTPITPTPITPTPEPSSQENQAGTIGHGAREKEKKERFKRRSIEKLEEKRSAMTDGPGQQSTT